MKEDNNRKAKLLTIGIAALLILIVCGISMVIHSINKREKEDTGSRLQSDIIEYANSTQEQTVTAEDVTKAQETDKTQGTGEDTEKTGADAKEPEKDAGQTEESGGQADGDKSAVVVDQKKNTEQETIMEEEASAQAAGETVQTTEKWQKEVSENLETVEIDLPRQMSEMKGYWEAGNMIAVEDLAYLPRYRAASAKLAGTAKYYYFGDTDDKKRPNGTGLAMYADNQYYYGEWKDGVRSGNGMWIKYYVYDKKAKAKDSIYLQHSYSGAWSNDLPNGGGTEHYDFIDENLEAGAGYNRNFIGTFQNGLYHGEIYITNYYSDGNVKEWTGTAENGVWKPLGEKDKKGQYPVIVETTNADNYQWMPEKENKDNGVDGLISAAR